MSFALGTFVLLPSEAELTARIKQSFPAFFYHKAKSHIKDIQKIWVSFAINHMEGK